ncbi:hypothetical protein TIFTF001_009303 [Ficus carica]|uniref:Protein DETOXIFICATION n=1 Tax=Ficus carica TaxID=3494 RepID=A0AA88AA68_FICCA|nr:hypothetical protein TIFTF001_009303 [Ficus carica]
MEKVNGNDHEGGDLNQRLLQEASQEPHDHDHDQESILLDDNHDLTSRVYAESKKLWLIVGPAIFSRVSAFSMNVITQAFAGHLGDVELASISIANTVIVGFNFGLLVGHWNG